MASFSLSSTSSTTNGTPLSNPPPKPFIPKTSQLSVHKHRSKLLLVSCKVTDNVNDETQDSNTKGNRESLLNVSNKVLDRRNVLVGLGGAVATASLGGIVPASLAWPVQPNVDICLVTKNGKQPPGDSDQWCCLDFANHNIVDFKPQFNPMINKFRRAAHLASLDQQYVRDFEMAIEAMKSKPANHPHSLEMQRRIHCAYCDGGFYQLPVPGGASDLRYKVHNSWLFAPFHRWYLYFFEKIAGKLIGKPDFALPYWAWDVPEGMFIPDMFNKAGSALNDPKRNENHRYKTVDLANFMDENPKPTVVRDNLVFMHNNMVDVTTTWDFFGAKYVAGQEAPAADAKPAAGALERSGHTSIHAWTGGDMGLFQSAGYDPMFYSHHANVDRMWVLWKSLRSDKEREMGPRRDYNDPEYLNASFVFWDENEQPVRVYVRDCLDDGALGIQYQDIPMPWIKVHDHGPGDQGPGDQGGCGGGGRGRGGPPGWHGRGGRGGPPGSHGPGGRGGHGGPPGWHGPGGRGGHGGPPGWHGPGGRGPGGPPGWHGPGGRVPGGPPGWHGPGGRGPGGPPGWHGPGGPPHHGVSLRTTEVSLTSLVTFPKALDTVVQVEVARPRKSRSEEEKQVEEEVLVVDVELSNTEAPVIKFDVYINDFEDHHPNEGTDINKVEYVGSFSTLPMNHHDGKMETSLKLPLSYIIEDLGADDDDSLQLTLVPISGQEAVVIEGVRIEYIRDE